MLRWQNARAHKRAGRLPSAQGDLLGFRSWRMKRRVPQERTGHWRASRGRRSVDEALAEEGRSSLIEAAP